MTRTFSIAVLILGIAVAVLVLNFWQKNDAPGDGLPVVASDPIEPVPSDPIELALQVVPRRTLESTGQQDASSHLVTVRGRCTTPEGTPLADVTVTLTADVRDTEIGNAFELMHGKAMFDAPPPQRTGADGRFAFTFTVPPDVLQIHCAARADGRASIRREVQTLVAGADVELMDLNLAKGATVTGILVDQDRRPLGNRELWFVLSGSDVEQEQSQRVVTAADGRFAFGIPVVAKSLIILTPTSARVITDSGGRAHLDQFRWVCLRRRTGSVVPRRSAPR